MDIVNGYKTYISVIAGLVATIAAFVAKGDFSIQSVATFVTSAALLSAIAALRHAFAKK